MKKMIVEYYRSLRRDGHSVTIARYDTAMHFGVTVAAVIATVTGVTICQ